MTYLNQSEIAANGAMFTRVAQCATQQSVDHPDDWTNANRRVWASAPGWEDAWASAKAAHPVDPDAPQSGPVYDPGADEAVITDAMILAQVQATMPQPTSAQPAQDAAPDA